MARCEACGRSIALARAACAYCGAPLRREDVPLAAPPVEPDEALRATDRELLVVDVREHPAKEVADALGVSLWEGGQIVRRGGDLLVGSFSRAECEGLSEGFVSQGFRTFRVPEAEARQPPVRAVSGASRDGGLTLRIEDGSSRRVGSDEVLLVVEAPIMRSFQTNTVRRRVHFRELGEGFRFHLHLREEAPPLELDPESFRFLRDEPVASAFLEMRQWCETLFRSAERDVGFRRLTPAFALAAPEAGHGFEGFTREREDARKDGGVVLDNLAQFRFYSGWRGGVERRR